MNPMTPGGINTGLKVSSDLMYLIVEKYKFIRRLLLVFILWITVDMMRFGKQLGLLKGDIPDNVTNIIITLIGLIAIFVSFYTVARMRESEKPSHIETYEQMSEEEKLNSKD